MIRNSEAYFAARSCGLLHESIHFLDLPFYETGQVKKKPISEEDISIVEKKMLEVKPDFMFAAGDLTDPHGTHRTCLVAILEAVKRVEKKLNFEVFLYRGAW